MPNTGKAFGESVSTNSSSASTSNPWPTSFPAAPDGMRSMERLKSQFLLRITAAVLSIVAFAVMAAASQTGTVNMTFSYFKALNYVFAVDLLVFVYSAVHCAVLAFSFIRKFEYNPPLAAILVIFTCDQVLSLLLFSASSSGAAVCELARNGITNTWPPICSTLHVVNFCTQAETAVALSFLASLCLIASTLFSGYHLAWQL